jgi:hypothetical protein
MARLWMRPVYGSGRDGDGRWMGVDGGWLMGEGACGPAARGGDLPAVTGGRSTLDKPGKTTQTHTTPRTLNPLIPWAWAWGTLEVASYPGGAG